jgi:hypothetical protein
MVQTEYQKQWYEDNKEEKLKKNKEWRDNNKERMKMLQKEWRANNAERNAAKQKAYKQTYAGKKTSRITAWKRIGVKSDDYNALYETYMNTHKCDRCNVEIIEGKGLNGKKHLDHDHETGCFRNVLCGMCNTNVLRRNPLTEKERYQARKETISARNKERVHCPHCEKQLCKAYLNRHIKICMSK